MSKGLPVLSIGQKIDGRYEVVQEIDTGGAGQVFKVLQTGLGVFRALKVLKPEHAGAVEYQDSFQQEINILSQLTHQHVVKIIDAGEEGSKGKKYKYFVMEFVDGVHLDKSAEALTSATDLLALFGEVLDGLEYLHNRKVLHSDLKPSNILVETDPITKRRHAKIADLGAAKNLAKRILASGELKLSSGSTEVTKMFGTRKYAPPELQRDLNDHPITDRELVELWPYADLFCLGAALAESVSTEKINKHILEELDILLKHPRLYLAENADAWEYLEGFIRRLLSRRETPEYFNSVHEAKEAFLRLDPARSLPERVPELTDVGAVATIRAFDGAHSFSKRSYALICHPTFQRLQKLNQLSFVDLIYPYARHSRFSHSLEVFQLAKRVATQLLRDTIFRLHVTPEDISEFLCAALLHDVGHYPLAHVLEDIRVAKPDFKLVQFFLDQETYAPKKLSKVLKDDWGIAATQIQHLVDEDHRDKLSTAGRFFQQLLSSPLDIDKMAYVFQDSVFTGVPFGCGVDVDFLIGSFVALSPRKHGPLIADITLGIDSKGTVAAAGLISARASLYGRVYWHHANRAIMSMVKYVAERVFKAGAVTFEKYIDDTWHFSEYEALRYLVEKLPITEMCSPTSNPALGILDGSRSLYKRLASYSHHRVEKTKRDIYEKVVEHDDEAALEKKRGKIREALAGALSLSQIKDYEVLIDVPKVQKEKEALSNIYVVDQYAEKKLRPLNEVTQVIDPLYREFSENVKKARVFISPRLRHALRQAGKEAAIVAQVDKILGGDVTDD
jgi:uncharacterized protein